MCSSLELWWGLFAISAALLVASAATYPFTSPGSATRVVATITIVILVVTIGGTSLLVIGCRRVH